MMLHSDALIADIRAALPPEADSAVVFGSAARGEDNEASDIDLIVAFSKRKSLLSLVALERQLEYAIGRRVEIVTDAALSPYLRDRILNEVRVVYEA